MSATAEAFVVFLVCAVSGVYWVHWYHPESFWAGWLAGCAVPVAALFCSALYCVWRGIKP